ncbi:MAG: TldD/PmbA family protein, partial [Ruminococcaceae bacterium]|nr:TldD/PmbA family protein [Oscillospiraceae bacterium]
MLNYDLYPYKAEMEADASTELRIQQNTKRKVSMMQGELITNIREDILGVGCRVYKNGLYGFASTPDLSSTGIKGVLKKASQNAGLLSSKIKTAKPAMLLPVGNGRYVTDYMMKTSDQKVYIDALRELDSYIIKNCPGLLNRSIVATEDSMEKLLAVSEGHDSHSIIPRSYIYVFMTVEGADGSPVEVFEPIGGFGVFEDNFASLDEAFKVTDELYKRAMDKKTAVYAKAGLKTCILGGHLTGMLAHEAVGHTCESDLVLSGSVAGEYLGKEV